VDERVRVYEQPPLRQVAGETIRPGGLELTERALSVCGLPPGAQVLDVGCGTGTTVEHLIVKHGLSAFGVDLSPCLLAEGRVRNRHLPLLQAPGEGLPLASSSVDAVLAECSLSLMADLGRVLIECRRVLRPGGKLAVTDLYARQPEGANALHRLPLCSCLSGALPQEELAARLQAQGFEVLLWEDHSPALKRFTAQLILAHGSLESFWRQMVPVGAGTAQIGPAIAAARPGYFLLIARALP
jgi:arsenite methyltransferase